MHNTNFMANDRALINLKQFFTQSTISGQRKNEEIRATGEKMSYGNEARGSGANRQMNRKRRNGKREEMTTQSNSPFRERRRRKPRP